MDAATVITQGPRSHKIMNKNQIKQLGAFADFEIWGCVVFTKMKHAGSSVKCFHLVITIFTHLYLYIKTEKIKLWEWKWWVLHPLFHQSLRRQMFLPGHFT